MNATPTETADLQPSSFLGSVVSSGLVVTAGVSVVSGEVVTSGSPVVSVGSVVTTGASVVSGGVVVTGGATVVSSTFTGIVSESVKPQILHLRSLRPSAEVVGSFTVAQGPKTWSPGVL